MSEKIKQKLHFVAYLDLLGYKDFFDERKNDAEEFLKTIDDALRSAKEMIQQNSIESNDWNPKVKMFSDNILIAVRSANKNRLDFLNYLLLVVTVAKIQQRFINNYKLFLRGGIAKGMFYFDEEYVFGEALIKAYEMEQNAIYPKIKIDDKYVESIATSIRGESAFKEAMIMTLIKYITKERDGSYFVNYLPAGPKTKEIDHSFCIDSIFADDMKPENKSISSIDERDCRKLQAHKEALLEKIHKFGSYKELFSQKQLDDRRKVILKYMWSLDYHNQVCKVLGFGNLMIHCDVKMDSRTLQPIVEVVEVIEKQALSPPPSPHTPERSVLTMAGPKKVSAELMQGSGNHSLEPIEP